MQISHVSDDDETFLDPLSARASVLKGLTEKIFCLKVNRSWLGIDTLVPFTQSCWQWFLLRKNILYILKFNFTTQRQPTL